jgi:tRNA-specific 2-thiouridylase
MFPIGDLNKKEVRLIATKQRLVTADKKDSQGLCFVGKVKLPEFLQQKLKTKKGLVIKVSSNNSNCFKTLDYDNHSIENLHKLAKSIDYSVNDGDVVGEHDGAHFLQLVKEKGWLLAEVKNLYLLLKPMF